MKSCARAKCDFSNALCGLTSSFPSLSSSSSFIAYAFGATVKAELLDLVQEHGKMTFEESEAYLRRLMDNGRFSADLAD